MANMGAQVIVPFPAVSEERDRPVLPALRGISPEAWAEQNADRIWDLMRATDRRDISFDDLAAKLWRDFL